MNNDSITWPPSFQSYEEFVQELEEAIRLHPDFGVWLSQKRNYDDLTSYCFFDVFAKNLTPNQLKKQYISERNIEILIKHSTRYTMLQKINRITSYENDKQMYEKEMSEFNEKKQKFEEKKQLYDKRTLDQMRPKPPRKPHSVEIYDRLQEIIKLNSFDVSSLQVATTSSVEELD